MRERSEGVEGREKGERIKRCLPLPPRRPCNLSKYNCILTNFKCILDAPSRIKFRDSYAGVLFLLKGYLLKIKPFEWVPEVKAGTHRRCHQPFPRPSCTYNIPEVAQKLRNVFSFPYIHCPHWWLREDAHIYPRLFTFWTSCPRLRSRSHPSHPFSDVLWGTSWKCHSHSSRTFTFLVTVIRTGSHLR